MTVLHKSFQLQSSVNVLEADNFLTYSQLFTVCLTLDFKWASLTHKGI